MKRLEDGTYEWKDNVTSVTTTPEGYSYVGSENKDILNDVNLSTTYAMSQSRVGVSFSGGQADYKGDPITTPASTSLAKGLSGGVPLSRQLMHQAL